MAIPVEMPKMSDTMEEGVLVSWQAEEGDELSAGDIIAQVETDKATMDLEVYDDGVLLKKVIQEGDSVPIGGLIAILGEEGEDVSDIVDQYAGQGAGEQKKAEAQEDEQKEAREDEQKVAREDEEKEAREDEEKEAEPHAAENAEGARKRTEPELEPSVAPAGGDGAQPVTTTAPSQRGDDGRLKSSPLARRMAREHKIELSRIQGSGPEGRIIKRDVEAAIEEGVAEPSVPRGDEVLSEEPEEQFETQSISQMRKTIARRLAQSKFTSPHFYLTVDVDMGRAVASREDLNRAAEERGDPKISFNDLITKACALALRRHPNVNASYLEKEGQIRRYGHVHVAVAVAIDEGLVTPVIRHADRKGLTTIAAETRELAAKARDRKLQPSDWEGSTFTTSNLGMYGIEEFTAIINPPNACILAIGAIRDLPVVQDGVIVAGKRMKLTLSCDHRIVDGATGAEFLRDVQHYLEEPVTMLL